MRVAASKALKQVTVPGASPIVFARQLHLIFHPGIYAGCCLVTIFWTGLRSAWRFPHASFI